MKSIILILLLLSYSFCFSTSLFDLEIMRQKFKNFEYDQVIRLAESALEHKEDLQKNELITIYEMKAVSHYSQTDMNKALESFIQLLKIDGNHSLDPQKHSPKIVAFFQDIKENIAQKPGQFDEPKSIITKTDTVTIVADYGSQLKKAVPASFVLPGSGHLLCGNKRKGSLYSTMSILALGTTIYAAIDCKEKENKYLNTTVANDIEKAYNIYNIAYKRRNTMVVIYSLLWIYVQADLLYIEKPKKRVEFSVKPALSDKGINTLCFSIHF